MPQAASKTPASPECEKMVAAQPRSQAIGDFLEWLETEKKIRLGTYHVHGPACEGWDADDEGIVPVYGYRCDKKHKHDALNCSRDRVSGCDLPTEALSPVHFTTEKLLAEYFEIDLNKVEAERRAILESLQS